jgi:1-phosphatidylinositol-3-phosphate 5-kinase
VTATHLKRLFANQDVFNTLDRNVAGLTVSEVDEKETKAGETDETTPLSTEPATPVPGESPDVSCSSSQVDLVGSEGITPLAGVMQIVRNPLSGSGPPSPGEYDSDSTVGAAPRRSPLASPGMSMDRLESSEMDSDAHAFVSRLPRRSKPAPRYAIGSFSLAACCEKLISAASPILSSGSRSRRRITSSKELKSLRSSDLDHRTRYAGCRTVKPTLALQTVMMRKLDLDSGGVELSSLLRATAMSRDRVSCLTAIAATLPMPRAFHRL